MNRLILHSPLIRNIKRSNNSVSICSVCILFLFISFLTTPAFSQTGDKKTLQNKYDKLQNEIDDAEDLLNSTKKKKENSLNELKLLNRKIDIREEVIGNISQQVKTVDQQMEETSSTIASMQDDMSELKEQYAKMVYYTYVNDQKFEPLHFIFSAKSINDAFERIQYVKTFHSFRKDQIDAIEMMSEKLEKKLESIKKDKVEKQDLLSKEEKEKNKLDSEKQQKDKTLKSLQAQEKDLKKQIDKKKKDAVDLNKKIQSVIAEEIKKEKEKAAAIAAAEAAKKKEAETKTTAGTETKSTTKTTTEAKTTTTKTASTENLGLTPEMQLISKNFMGNKGKLPWPVERGTITERFGKHPHPVLKDVMVENNGIDILTNDGAAVRSIFDGTVVNVIFNPSFQKGVIIKHGEYYSVYTNLSDVTVKAGDKITTKQRIGTAWENPEEEKTEVHLEIWKNTVLLDPALWINK